jgi:hypothetical protein
MKSIIIISVFYAFVGVAMFAGVILSLHNDSFIPAIIFLVASLFCFGGPYGHLKRNKRNIEQYKKLRRWEKTDACR